jgi:uncharacterized DUF497 family protein
VEIEFDPEKDAINRRKHGVSLADAAQLDFATAAYEADRRYNDREERFQAHGLIAGRLHVRVFTMRATRCGRSHCEKPGSER